MYDLFYQDGKAFITYSGPGYFQKVTVLNTDNTVISEASNNEEIDRIILAWLKTVKGFEVIQYNKGEFRTKIALKRTSEPFKADRFEIEKYYDVGDTRTFTEKIYNCIRFKSLKPWNNKNLWSPSTKHFSFNYSFVWSRSDKEINIQ